MENENKQELELENNEGEGSNEGEVKPKPELTPEQIEGIERRQLTKLMKKFGVEAPKKPEPEKPVEKGGFDYGELAYLIAKNIPEEDHDWLFEGVQDTKKELKDLMKSEWVQKELKERQTARMADAAVPTGTKRSQGGSFTEDTVEYWVAANKQPPESKPLAFRKKVLEARKSKVVDENKFARNSIVAPGFPL